MLAKIHVSVKTERNISRYFAKTESKKVIFLIKPRGITQNHFMKCLF